MERPERRAQGEGGERGGIRNTETEEWKETRGMAGWGGLQAWGPAWPWAVGTGSAPCTCGGGWSGHTSRQKSALREICQRATDPSPAGACAGISSSTQGKCSSCPSKCTETSPLSSSQAPASPTPPPWETKFSRNLSHQSQNLSRLAAPLFPVLPSASPFLPPSHFPFPSWRRVSGHGMQTPLPLCKASGPHPQSKGEWVGVCLPTHFPARMRSSPGYANLGPVSY